MSALGTRKRISAKHAQRPPHLVLLETKFEFIVHPFSVIIIWTKIRYTSSNGRRRRILLYATQETLTIYVYRGKNEKPKPDQCYWTRAFTLCVHIRLNGLKIQWRMCHTRVQIPKAGAFWAIFVYREMTNNRDPTIFETFFNDLFFLFIICYSSKAPIWHWCGRPNTNGQRGVHRDIPSILVGQYARAQGFLVNGKGVHY